MGKKSLFLFSGLFMMILILSACGRQERSIIQIDGSSTVYPITEAVAEEFGATHRDIRITIGISGTGGGFKKFARGETDISNASRPVTASELSELQNNKIEFIELPIAFDGLAVVINPANNWVDYLSVSELKKMWEPEAQGKIKTWSQIREGWPDHPLRLYGAGTESGTFDYFTEAIVGKRQASRGDFTASEDDNVLVHGVANDRNALGYFGLAYFVENSDKLKLVPIKNDAVEGAEPVLPTIQNITEGKYNPLSRPEFIYVKLTSAERPDVQTFVHYFLQNCQPLIKEVGYIPLPDKAYSLNREIFDSRITGTSFENKESLVGADIVKILENKLYIQQ